jgi:hypothetical protein
MSEHETKIAEECGKFVIKSNKLQQVILIDLISKVTIWKDGIKISFLSKSGLEPILLDQSDFEDTTWLYLQDFFTGTYPQIPAPGISMEGE